MQIKQQNHKATGAERIFVTHGYSEIFAEWLNENGYDAKEVKTQYEGELGEIIESQTE
jgi:putative mRNA 3-end processing factor